MATLPMWWALRPVGSLGATQLGKQPQTNVREQVWLCLTKLYFLKQAVAAEWLPGFALGHDASWHSPGAVGTAQVCGMARDAPAPLEHGLLVDRLLWPIVPRAMGTWRRTGSVPDCQACIQMYLHGREPGSCCRELANPRVGAGSPDGERGLWGGSVSSWVQPGLCGHSGLWVAGPPGHEAGGYCLWFGEVPWGVSPSVDLLGVGVRCRLSGRVMENIWAGGGKPAGMAVLRTEAHGAG